LAALGSDPRIQSDQRCRLAGENFGFHSGLLAFDADRDSDFRLAKILTTSFSKAAVAVTGLSGLVGDIEKRLVENAGQTLRDGAVLVV
jgi:hypothetical protein